LDRKIVIIPTYNEKENIEAIIRKVFSLPVSFDILIVDDNSPDGTATIVKQLQSTFSALHLLERSEKTGLGTAYIAGFKWCIERNYTHVIEMDADFSHNPEDLPKLYNACVEGADVSIGSRYVTGVNVVNWPMSRVMLSYFASKYVRLITNMPIHDTTAGFVCYSINVLRQIELDKIRFKGYAFQIEMKFTAWKYGYNLVEVPIIFTDRTLGQSKISKNIIREAVWGVLGLKIKSWFKQYKRT
jgi:dolichol-phosphate mannosyltransferase